MQKVLLTHGSIDINTGHTSWSEIYAFNRFVESKNTQTTLLSPSMITSNVLRHYDKLIVFNSGIPKESLINAINDSEVEVFLVYQDPNWGIKFNIQREYTLITPFHKFKRLSSYDSVMRELKSIVSDAELSKFKKHLYLPFGNMSLFDSYYDDQSIDIEIDQTFDCVYIGSHKKDRNQMFLKMSKLGVDLYGNFDNDRLNRDLKLTSDSKLSLKGRIPANSVTSVASRYREVIYAPDIKMLKLDVCHRRQTESLSSKIRIMSTSSHLRDQLKMIAKRIDKDIYQFDRKKLISHYGKFTKSVVSKSLGLDEETITLGDLKMISTPKFMIDRASQTLIKIEPQSVYYDADSSTVKCLMTLSSVANVSNKLYELKFDTEFDLPIYVEKFSQARPFTVGELSIVQINESSDLTSSVMMKLSSIAKRNCLSVILELLEKLKENA